MQLETLIEICRPGELKNYSPLSDWGMDEKNIEHSIAKKYEVIDDDFNMSGNGGYLNDCGYYYIIKNKETGKHFRVEVGHDSWTDSLIDSFNYAKIFEVEPKEVTIIEYEGETKTHLEDL